MKDKGQASVAEGVETTTKKGTTVEENPAKSGGILNSNQQIPKNDSKWILVVNRGKISFY